MNSTQPVIPEPSAAELNILRVLWKHGPCSLSVINDALSHSEGEILISTTFKQLHIMENKRFIQRIDRKYVAIMDEEPTKLRLVEKFVHTHFDGSHQALIQLLESRLQ